jgi:hypothetical protein
MLFISWLISLITSEEIPGTFSAFGVTLVALVVTVVSAVLDVVD